MIYVSIMVAIFILELWIKNKVEKNKEGDSKKPIIKDLILRRKYHNEGAFLNLGNKVRPLMAFLSLAFTIAMAVFFVLTLTLKGHNILKTGLAFLLGGAFSNTYDRLKRKYVVDYFSFQTKSPRINSVIFNIADFCILIGALLLCVASVK